MHRLVSGSRHTIKSHGLVNLQEAIDSLSKAVKNIPKHVFGNHEECSDTCRRKQRNTYPARYLPRIMKECDMLFAIMDEVNRVLISCCNTHKYSGRGYMSQLSQPVAEPVVIVYLFVTVA